jgi:hypothetical protein
MSFLRNTEKRALNSKKEVPYMNQVVQKDSLAVDPRRLKILQHLLAEPLKESEPMESVQEVPEIERISREVEFSEFTVRQKLQLPHAQRLHGSHRSVGNHQLETCHFCSSP